MPCLRGFSVLAIVYYSLFLVGVGVLIGFSWFADPAASHDWYEFRWISLAVFLLWVALYAWVVSFYAWRIAVLQRKSPIAALVREGSGVAVAPVRYMGIRHGRVRVTKQGPRLDKHDPLIVRRGDEVRLSVVKERWALGRGRRQYIRLRIEAPSGFYRSRVGLWASELDLEGFEALLRSEGISLVYGPLAD